MVAAILRLTSSGLPVAWLHPEQAAVLYAKDLVTWEAGDNASVLNGGVNAQGVRSRIVVSSIIACEGRFGVKSFVPPLHNMTLFRRDRMHCLYCGEAFKVGDLTRDHVVPRVQGGADSWTNVVTACQPCNNRKGGRTPEQAGMPLLAIPFEPNRFEFMYLANRRIQQDQMAYLCARFSGQRSWQAA